MNTQQMQSTPDYIKIHQEILSLLQLGEDELSEDHLCRLRFLTEAVSLEEVNISKTKN